MTPPPANELPSVLIARAVEAALAEDLGLLGDITSRATIPEGVTATARLVARKEGVVAGLVVAETAFRALNPACRFEAVAQDGDKVAAGAVMATVSGNAGAILSAERVALNFVGRMSGIATLTRRYVDAIAGTQAQIVDTRKTTPGLRAFEKYAVRMGGGSNHRAGLFDAVLIKDNHIVAAGGIDAAIRSARAAVGHMVKIEVEVDTLKQLDKALAHKIDAVLLDNMSLDQLRDAVRRIAGRALAEASGGVSLETVRAIAETGVDLISVGALTHSVPVLDVALDFVPEPNMDVKL